MVTSTFLIKYLFVIFGLLSLKHYFVHFARIGRKDSELSGKYIPKKFFSCPPRFALGSRLVWV